jgi:hypothetical protein
MHIEKPKRPTIWDEGVHNKKERIVDQRKKQIGKDSTCKPKRCS